MSDSYNVFGGRTGPPGSQWTGENWFTQFLPPNLQALITGVPVPPVQQQMFPGSTPTTLPVLPGALPSRIVAGVGQGSPMRGPAGPVIQPQSAPPGAIPPALQTPRIPRTQASAGAGETVFSLNTPTLPAPPMLQPPPARGGVRGVDFGPTNQWLDKAAPTQSGHLAAVLGGFAQGAAGAGQVPTVGQVLASIGGGGSQGFQRSAGEHTDYAKTRATSALDQAKLKSENDRENSRIAFENAKLAYDTNIRNQTLQYEHELKKHDMAMPKTQLTANGLIVSQPDPTSGKTTVTFHSTKSQMDQLEKIESLAKVMGMPGPFAEGIAVKALSDMYKDNPVAGAGAMRQLAVQHTITRGAGPAVFGAAYNTAVKEADKLLRSENPTLISKPAEFQTELQRRVTAILLSQPWINRGEWIPRAAQQGVLAAQILVPESTPEQPAVPGQTVPPRRPAQPLPRPAVRQQPGTIGEE